MKKSTFFLGLSCVSLSFSLPIIPVQSEEFLLYAQSGTTQTSLYDAWSSYAHRKAYNSTIPGTMPLDPAYSSAMNPHAERRAINGITGEYMPLPTSSSSSNATADNSGQTANNTSQSTTSDTTNTTSFTTQNADELTQNADLNEILAEQQAHIDQLSQELEESIEYYERELRVLRTPDNTPEAHQEMQRLEEARRALNQELSLPNPEYSEVD